MAALFKLEELELAGTFRIKNHVFLDERGCFYKTFEKTSLKQAGIEFECQEMFFSTSKKSVLRGLHFQTNKPQAKLVSVISGRVFDVIVDLRKNSKTYGQWIGVDLNENDKDSLYIPKGCAHGFVAIEDSIMSYTCDGEYDVNTDTGIKYNDADIGIEWPKQCKEFIISNRDKEFMSFKDFDSKIGGF